MLQNKNIDQYFVCITNFKVTINSNPLYLMNISKFTSWDSSAKGHCSNLIDQLILSWKFRLQRSLGQFQLGGPQWSNRGISSSWKYSFAAPQNKFWGTCDKNTYLSQTQEAGLKFQGGHGILNSWWSPVTVITLFIRITHHSLISELETHSLRPVPILLARLKAVLWKLHCIKRHRRRQTLFGLKSRCKIRRSDEGLWRWCFCRKSTVSCPIFWCSSIFHGQKSTFWAF